MISYFVWKDDKQQVVGENGEVQTASFGQTYYSIHSGYLYQKDNCHGIAMLIDR